MKSAVTPPRTRSVSQNSVDATRHARWRSPFSSRSLNTGTNAPESAASARSARTTFGMRIATVNALMSPVTPKKYALTISRTRPSTREIAVASEKTAVERAIRRLLWPGSGVASDVGVESIARCDSPSGVCYHRPARGSGHFLEWRTSSNRKSAS